MTWWMVEPLELTSCLSPASGALACYIAGEDRVIPLSFEELDSVTPNKDFASDVVARAHWFAQNGF